MNELELIISLRLEDPELVRLGRAWLDRDVDPVRWRRAVASMTVLSLDAAAPLNVGDARLLREAGS